MTFNTWLSTVLIIAGLFLIFKISPHDLFSKLFRPLIKKLDRQAKIRSITGKKPNFIHRQLHDAQQMLEAAGMGEQLKTYRWLSFILASLGFAYGYLIDNLLAAIVLAIGLAIAPQAIIQIRTGEYLRGLQEKLEIGMGIITNSYLQTGDLVGTIQESHHLLPVPLDGVFKSFLVETQFIDANLVRALEQMRSKIDHYYWQEWCSVLIQCQHDRQLRFALPGIVDRLSETRRIQLEIDTTIRKHFGDYIITVMIVLGSIPLMGLMMPEWYEMLMGTLAGKITLAVVLAAILATAIWVARINRPMNLEKGGDLG
jgi:tight adherence protein B